jgi:antitoxin ParD1/3/4
MTATVQVALPDPLKSYVESRVADGDYGTPGEYIRTLIQEDWERRRERLEAVLTNALKSRPIPISADELEQGNLVSLLRKKLARP